MRRPTERLSHKSQESSALQQKPPGPGRTQSTTAERQDRMQRRSKSRFLAHVTVLPAKRLRLLSLFHCAAAFLECHRLQDTWHSVIILTSSWDQFGEKKKNARRGEASVQRTQSVMRHGLVSPLLFSCIKICIAVCVFPSISAPGCCGTSPGKAKLTAESL